MKFPSYILFLSFLLSLVSVVACHKAEDDSDDMTAPVLTITSPTDNASMNGAVVITGQATDNSLHEMSIKITKDADGSILWEKSPTVHDLTEYAINQTWTPSGIMASTPVTLTVTVEDHNENAVTKTVKFVVNP